MTSAPDCPHSATSSTSRSITSRSTAASLREILRDPIDREMVRSINEIGHLTGKQTIAEFAENAEIIQMLTSLGVDYAQGYGVAQPQRVLKSAVA